MTGIKYITVILFLLVNVVSKGQITSGKILFERRTNVEKKFKNDENIKEYLNGVKTKTDLFELYFNDTNYIFKPQANDEVDEIGWTTTSNTTYQNFNTERSILLLSILGQPVTVIDSNLERRWQMTDSKRVICNYECRKAFWQKNDSIRIYAWFCQEIVPAVGPESFTGLPGAILGLATEDGSVIYFAKSVEVIQPKKEDFAIEIKKKKIYTYNGLRTQLVEDYGKEKWGGYLIQEVFRWL